MPCLGIRGGLSLYQEDALRKIGAVYVRRKKRGAPGWDGFSHYAIPLPLMQDFRDLDINKGFKVTRPALDLRDSYLAYAKRLEGIKANDMKIVEPILLKYNIDDTFFKREPKVHQKSGMAFFLAALELNSGHICLFDEMRTGKTKQAIDIARWLIREKRISGALIICPNSIKQVWINELFKDAPLYSMLSGIISGTKGQKKKQWGLNNFFYIVNYESARADKEEMYRWQERKADKGWLLICDEAHKLKNPDSQQSKAIFALEPDYSVFLTGTPIANRPDDVFAVANFVCPGILGSTLWHFRERFGTRGGFKGKQVTGYHDLDIIKSRLDKISIRRLRRDIVPDQVIHMPRYGQLAGDQLKAYNDMRDFLYAEISKTNGDFTSVQAQNQLVKVLRLQQITAGYLSAGSGDYVWFDSNWKLKELDSFIDEYLGDIGKLVIWCRFVPTIEMLVRRYEKYGAVRIRGQMGSMATENMYKFQRDPETRIMVAQIQTSEGRGFQPATFALFWGKWWSPYLNKQARDRILGIENPVPVTVISFITQDTVDERLEWLLARKRKWAQGITGDVVTDIHLPDMDKKTLLYLLARPEEARRYEGEHNGQNETSH